MHIPLLSPCAESCSETWGALQLWPRSPIPEPKGGGGHGGSKGGSHSSSESSGSKESTSGSSGSRGSTTGSRTGSTGSTGSVPNSAPPVGFRGSTVSVSGTTFGSGKTTSVPYGSGGVRVTTIPRGQPFAGRTYGGATRGDVYGTSVYGSGYPGVSGIGVTGRNFPYIYPPIIWVDHGYGPHYLHSSREYGEPTSTNRTGGPEMQAAFTSSSSSSNSTFRIIADDSTVTSLVASIKSSCWGKFAVNSSTTPVPYGNSSTPDPRPESAIQYYRASGVVLTLDGYNNTAALSTDSNAKAVPLPSNVDRQLLSCLNSTIGDAVPLFNSAARTSSLHRPEMAGTLGLVFVVVWHLFSWF